MEKKEMEKKFKGYNTQLLQNKFKKTTSEVEKEVISSILQKRGVLPLEEEVKDPVYSKKDEPIEESVSEVQSESIVKPIKKDSVRNKKELRLQSLECSVKVGDVISFNRSNKDFKGPVTEIYKYINEGVEVLVVLDEASKNTVFIRTSSYKKRAK